jgi:type IV pilus assembly protein PilY1
VLHSRPAVVNYGSGGVVVFYGGNDGMLHAITGNQGGAGAGEELWSFVPEEVFGKLNRLRVANPEVRVPSTPASSTATPRDYFVDGPISVYQKINASGSSERVVIYVAMRRGGRQLYAIDVTVPGAPIFLWKKSGGSGDVALLGQTWAEPKVARIKGHANPVLVVGGGYDAGAEDGTAQTATTMGNVVYVLDALDGTVLRTFTTLSGSGSIARSIAADVSLADSDGDGKIDRAYAVDLGGQVYRLDFESASGSHAPSDWSIRKFADLSGGTTTGRKFFFAPDVIVTRDFTALTFGSGDREKPLLSATQDHFFQIFDRHSSKGLPVTSVPIVWADLRPASSSSDVSGSGCYLPLEQGEKVVNASTSIAGYSYFGTNRPTSVASTNSCAANLGTAKSYAMPLFCVAASGQVLAGGGLPPSPVAGLVTVSYTAANGAQATRQVPFVIGAPNPSGSAIQASRPRPSVNAPRLRRYWFQEVRR